MESGRRPGKERVDPYQQRTARSRRSQSRLNSAHQVDLREELERKRRNDLTTMAGSSQGRTLVAIPHPAPIMVSMTAEVAEAMEAMLHAYHAPAAGVTGVPIIHYASITQGTTAPGHLVAPKIPNPSQGKGPARQHVDDNHQLSVVGLRPRKGPSKKNSQPKGSVFSRLSEGLRPSNRNPLNQPARRWTEELEESQDELRVKNPSRAPQRFMTQGTIQGVIQSPSRKTRREHRRLAKLAAEIAANQPPTFKQAYVTPIAPLQPKALFPQKLLTQPQSQFTPATENKLNHLAQMPMTPEEAHTAFQAFLMTTYNPTIQGTSHTLGAAPTPQQWPTYLQHQHQFYQTPNAGIQAQPTTTSHMVGNVTNPTMALVLEEVRNLSKQIHAQGTVHKTPRTRHHALPSRKDSKN